MKKVLFASTALVAFSGAAVADVALSGRAEMGIATTSRDNVDWQFFTDIDVTFTMTGETDNGLTFGASVDLDESTAATFAPETEGGETIFISGGFGTVTMGDTDGAMDWALTEAGNVGNGGSIADDETSHAGYLGAYLDGAGDGQILRWDYSVGDFGVAVSLEQGDTDLGGPGVVGEEDGFGIGFRYSVNLGGADVDLGLAYQEFGLAEAVGFSATATLANGLSAGIVYTDFDNATVDYDPLFVVGNPVDSHLGFGIGYTTGALTVHMNYGEFDGDVGGVDHDGIGLSGAYDLGGGAVVHFGYGESDVDTVGRFKSASLGLGLSF